MPANVFTVDVDFKKVEKFIKAGTFSRVLNKHATRQLLGFGTVVKSVLKRKLAAGIDGPALGVQQYIKGNQKLLVHTSRFLNAARFQYWKEQHGIMGVQVGWFEGSTLRGLPYPKLATILEEGREWSPTDGERLAVAMKVKASGAAPKPSGDKKSMWRIPPRPFFDKVMEDPIVMKKFIESGANVLERTMKELIG